MLERHARLVVEPVRQAARMDLKRAARPSLSESVLEQLLSAFREGKLKPGVRLPSEYELSAMLGVGRSSVREAMRVLTFMGLIETKPGRGAVVLTGLQNPVPPTGAAGAVQRSAMRDLYEVRSVLEGGAAAIAAKRATLADLVAMERAARIIEARVARGRPYFRENVEFHLAIARATHNHILLESVRYGLEHRPEAVAHSMPLARGMDTSMADKFIGMYVNEFTLDYGETGRRAIHEFLAAGHRAGVVPAPVELEFVE